MLFVQLLTWNFGFGITTGRPGLKSPGFHVAWHSEFQVHWHHWLGHWYSGFNFDHSWQLDQNRGQTGILHHSPPVKSFKVAKVSIGEQSHQSGGHATAAPARKARAGFEPDSPEPRMVEHWHTAGTELQVDYYRAMKARSNLKVRGQTWKPGGALHPSFVHLSRASG